MMHDACGFRSSLSHAVGIVYVPTFSLFSFPNPIRTQTRVCVCVDSFLPTCTEELLRGLGDIVRRHPGVHVQSHISESADQV